MKKEKRRELLTVWKAGLCGQVLKVKSRKWREMWEERSHWRLEAENEGQWAGRWNVSGLKGKHQCKNVKKVRLPCRRNELLDNFSPFQRATSNAALAGCEMNVVSGVKRARWKVLFIYLFIFFFSACRVCQTAQVADCRAYIYLRTRHFSQGVIMRMCFENEMRTQLTSERCEEKVFVAVDIRTSCIIF